MKRKDFIKLASFSGIPFMLKPLNAKLIRKKPNIIFAFSDEHRYQSMSMTETPELITPNMARMAKEGISFDNCISNNPVCAPFRSMLMTGEWCYSSLMLENNGKMPNENKKNTLGKIFTKAGYETCYIGKWHIGMDEKNAGFRKHYGWSKTNNHWDSTYTEVHGKGKNVSYKKYNAVGMTDQALDFIDDNYKKENPFFIMVSWNPPHAIFTDPPEEKRKLYNQENLTYRKNIDKEKIEAWWKKYQGYHAHISAIDDELGRLINKLKKLKIEEETILIYTADHGSMMNSHGKGNKRHPYEESIRIPFLIRYPGKVPAGIKKKELFSSIDMYPTLCGLAGITRPSNCHGLDFSGHMLGTKGPDPESSFIMHISNKKTFAAQKKNPKRENSAPYFRGVRTKKHTYTINIDGEWQLFDNVKNPFQMNNLIQHPDYTEVRKKCREMLDEWLEKAEYKFMSDKDKKRLKALPLNERIKLQSVEALTIHGNKIPGIPGQKQKNKKKKINILPDEYYNAGLSKDKILKLEKKRAEIFTEEKLKKWKELRKQNKEAEYKALMKSMQNDFKKVLSELLTRQEQQKIKKFNK